MTTKPAFILVGTHIHTKGEKETMTKLWEGFMAREGEIHNPAEPGVYYGLMRDYDEKSGRFEYVAGVRVKDDRHAPFGMTVVNVPEQLYAVYECTLAQIGDTYKQFNEQWLPTSAYTRAYSPDFELYERGFDNNNPQSTLHIYIPVEKKPAMTAAPQGKTAVRI